MGTLLLARGHTSPLNVAVFLLDSFAHGVKDVMFRTMDGEQIEQYLDMADSGSTMVPIVPSDARKLLRELTAWSKEHGFAPHRDSGAVEKIFGDVNADDSDRGLSIRKRRQAGSDQRSVRFCRRSAVGRRGIADGSRGSERCKGPRRCGPSANQCSLRLQQGDKKKPYPKREPPVCGTVVPNEPSRSFRSAGVGAIPLWHDRGACSLASCAIASFGEGPAMKLRYIIAIMAAALAVSYHHQDTRLAGLVIFCTCILYSLRCIDYQLGDM